MAVQIPVIIDIEGAFNEAAKRVPAAMKPLQNSVDSIAGDLKINVSLEPGGADMRSLKSILKMMNEVAGDTDFTMEKLNKALDNAKIKLDALYTAAAHNGGQMNANQRLLSAQYQEAIALLTAEIDLRTKASSLVEQQARAAIAARDAELNRQQVLEREDNSLSEVNEKLSVLRNKLEHLPLTGQTEEWRSTSKEIENATKELAGYQAKLTTYTTKPGSINRMRAEMAALRKEWDAMSKTTKFDKDGNLTASAQRVIDKFRELTKEVEKTGRSLDSYAKEATKSTAALNTQLDITGFKLGNILKRSIELLALRSGTRFLRNVREVTAEFEMQRVALGGIIQDTEMAESLFREIKAAALKSPFEIKDLVRFTKQLSAYRIETDQLFDVTMKLADISAGLGVDMNRLVLAYGQVRAASVLRGQELRQFTEAGIPLVELLAEKFEKLGREGTTTADVFELISKRAVPFSMIAEIFDDMTSAGGMFYKMQEKQSETLKGQWMKLKDAVSIMYDEIGNTPKVRATMEWMISVLMKLMRNWRGMAKTIGTASVALVTYKIVSINAAIAAKALTRAEAEQRVADEAVVIGKNKVVAAIFKEEAATKLQTWLSKQYTKAKIAELTATNLFTKALYAQLAAMLKNPYVAIAAGIIMVVAALTRLLMVTKQATISYEDFQSSLEKYKSAIDQVDDIEKLCDSYDELIAKTEKTEAEEKKLERTTKELAKTYPQFIKDINGTTKAIELNTEAIRNANDKAREAIRLSLAKDILSGKKSLQDLRDQYDEIMGMLESGMMKRKVPKYGGTYYTEMTESDMAELGRQLLALIPQIAEFEGAVSDAETELNKMKNTALVDFPQPSEFMGDDWRYQLSLYKVLLEDATEATKAFTPEQIRAFDDQKKAAEATASEYKKQAALVEFYGKVVEKGSSRLRKQAKKNYDAAVKMRDMYKKILEDMGAEDLIADTTRHGSGGGQDPVITMWRNRLQVVKDYQKALEDLRKYMVEEDAVAEAQRTFRARAKSLGIDITDANYFAGDPQGIRDYFESLKNEVENQFRAISRAYKNFDIEQILSLELKPNSKAYRYQQFLADVYKTITDFDINEFKRELDNKIKDLSDEMKRSETVRKFYEDILDQTGDAELAKSLTLDIYGGDILPGDFRDRLQQQLYQALTKLDPKHISQGLSDELSAAITVFDIDTIRKNLDKLPPKVKEVFKKALESDEAFRAQWEQNFFKTYAKAKTYAERIATLESQRNTALEEAQKLGKGDAELEAVRAYYAEKIAGVQLEALKDTYTWTKAFEDLDGVSTRTLNNLIDLIDEYVEKYSKDLDPQQLKELTRAKEQAKAQILSRNSYLGAYDALERLLYASGKMSELTAAGKEETEEYTKALDEQKRAFKDMSDAVENINSDISTLISTTSELFTAFGKADDADYFSEQMDRLSKTISGVSQAGMGILRLAMGDFSPQAIMMTIKGLADTVIGIADMINGGIIRKADKGIEKQAKLIEDLEYGYDRLSKSIEKAFGSDRVHDFNQQMEILYAKQMAYQKQADLERQKGKKADEDKIREYEKAARDAADEIRDAEGQLAEFFAGTDVTSAAKDFASAWIDAYKEFGSTTDAMKEKFQDMIQSMIENSLAAKIMQSILDPLFKEIDDMAKSGGMLDSQEIADIAKKAPQYIDQINGAMTVLMNQLAAAGLNVRNQAGTFTGIKRDLATATEESINGLAAGINTQNYYMSYMPMIHAEVQAIRAAITGETETGATQVGVSSPYQTQMLEYASHIPTIDQNVAALLIEIRKVIKPMDVKPTYALSIKMN